MAMIYVRAKEGRKLFYEGRIIPTDQFIPVTDSPYIRRLAEHWGDLDLQTQTAKAPRSYKAPSTPTETK